MYIKRTPLGQGNLSFRKHRARYPTLLVIAYLAVLAAAAGAYFMADQIRPAVVKAIAPPAAASPVPEKLVRLAAKAYMQGDLAASSEFYRQAAALEPDDMDMLTAYGRVLVLNKQLSEAQAVADHMIEIAPQDARGYAVRSRALDWNGQYPDSVLAGLKAIELDSNYAPAHAYLAEAYADLGRLRQARQEAETAIQLDPYNVDARRDYGYVLEFYGDYEGAVQQYIQALKLEPNSLDLIFGLAINYRGAKRYDEAISTLNDYTRRTLTDPTGYIELGRTYFEIREDDAAQENLEHAVELVCKDCPLHDSNEILQNPDFFATDRTLPDKINMQAWIRLGQVYSTRRNFESSIAILEEAIGCSEKGACGIAKGSAPIEAYYVTAAAYYYLDECKLAVTRARTALDIYVANYKDKQVDDPNALKNTLSIFILCRDYADTPYVYSGPGFTNGYPDGYAVVDVVVKKPNAVGPTSGTATPAPKP